MDTKYFSNQSYYDNFNPKIYDLVEMNKKVLDVGCSTGRLLAALKHNKNCYVVGIERNEKMADEARKVADEIIVTDIESDEKLPFEKKYFDVIIFGDVLEHLVNPEKALVFFRDYLNDEGYILISLPNVAFITVRLGLLFGKFNYKDCGILDRTHLHFYTLESAKDLIKKCGFSINYMGSFNPVRKRYFLMMAIGTLIFKRMFTIDFIFKVMKRT